jgi:BlaI family transcriptional regulator, penicillinase repressor
MSVIIPKPTDSELQILQILWQFGPSTVRFVNEKINLEKPVGYTTTLKIMQIMFEKKLVKREMDGKTHIYQANITEKDTQDELLDRFLNLAFNGSAMKLVMHALGNSRTTKQELDEIRKMLDKLEKTTNDEPA